MAIPYTGLFIAASCNSRFSHGRYTRSYGTVPSIGLLGQNCKPYMVAHYTFSIHFSFQSNNGDLVPLKPTGINHVHRPTHASTGPRVRQSRGCHFNFFITIFKKQII